MKISYNSFVSTPLISTIPYLNKHLWDFCP